MPWKMRFLLKLVDRYDNDLGIEGMFEGKVVDRDYMIVKEIETNSMHMQVPASYHKVKIQGYWCEVSEVRWDYDDGIVRVYLSYTPPKRYIYR